MSKIENQETEAKTDSKRDPRRNRRGGSRKGLTSRQKAVRAFFRKWRPAVAAAWPIIQGTYGLVSGHWKSTLFIVSFLAALFIIYCLVCWWLSWRLMSSVLSALFVAALLSFAGLEWSGRIPDETRHQWLPPQLAEGTKVAYLLFIDKEFKIDLEAVKTNNNEFGLPDFPDILKVRLNNSRLYVEVANTLNAQFAYPNWPSKWMDPTTNQNSAAFSDILFLDQKLPLGYDRNYSANAIEIVNETGIPVHQAIYERPNAVRVNGIFGFFKEGLSHMMGTYVYGKRAGTYSFENVNAMNTGMAQFKTNCLFKYPSYSHLGEYRDK